MCSFCQCVSSSGLGDTSSVIHILVDTVAYRNWKQQMKQGFLGLMGGCESPPPQLNTTLNNMVSFEFSLASHVVWSKLKWINFVSQILRGAVSNLLSFHLPPLSSSSMINGSRHVPHFIVASVNVSVPSADILLNYFLSCLGPLQWNTGQMYLCISYQDNKALNALL